MILLGRNSILTYVGERRNAYLVLNSRLIKVWVSVKNNVLERLKIGY